MTFQGYELIFIADRAKLNTLLISLLLRFYTMKNLHMAQDAALTWQAKAPGFKRDLGFGPQTVLNMTGLHAWLSYLPHRKHTASPLQRPRRLTL
jgi:hypothetical protein